MRMRQGWAIGGASLSFSHVSDAGFWLVKEYFGLSIGETLMLDCRTKWLTWRAPTRCE